MVFQKKSEEYAARMKGATLADRAESLAKLRDADGCMSECVASDAASSVAIVEHHSPILDVLRAFPIVARLETEMFQRLLGSPVTRSEENASGLFRATFSTQP